MIEMLQASSGWALTLYLFAALTLLFLAREPVHRAIRSFTKVLYRSFRMAARSISKSEERLQLRNREVLLAAGREHAERVIEREFERVEASMQSELSEYPALHRKLSENISAIEDDFQKSAEVPPEPTGWSKAVRAISELPTKDDPVIGHVMEDIAKSMSKAEAKALESYRHTAKTRHETLKKMMPRWRAIQKHLTSVDKTISSLLQRGQALDRHMDDYEHIQQGTNRAIRMLSSSSISQFFISAFVLIIAVGGAIINFNLIARPMAEMVGGTSMIGHFQIADIAALVIILVEISMGLFLMECLRITRLFPVIHALNDRLRVRMMWISFTILLLLASVEAGLAFMREILMQEDLAISAHLRGAEADAIDNSVYWITTASQMGMGFILPFALTFVAIPLENFISSLRTVLGIVGAFGLRALALTFRLFGSLCDQLGKILVNLYDLIIFVPLAIENKILHVVHSSDKSDSTGKYAGGKAA